MSWIAFCVRLCLLDVGGFKTVHQDSCLYLRKPNLLSSLCFLFIYAVTSNLLVELAL